MDILNYMNVKPYTVSQITALIRDCLEEGFFEIWVEGEVSDLRIPSSGHVYFILKDKQAQLRCVLFKGSQRFIRFQPEDGMRILVRGKITVYERRGEYQLICDYMEPLGSGALQKAFDQLKNRLAKEGLFDESRKRPIPLLPERIGIVTSPTGAAIRDILNILTRRFVNVRVLINPVRVQGEGAAEEIARAIKELEDQPGVDVIIVTRGGGSLEDLWAFNEEIVARAIYNCRLPVISAVGHEIDYTISDFVADLRAPTPSAAAELVIQNRKHLEEILITQKKRMEQIIYHRIEMDKTRILHLNESRILRDPLSFVRSLQESVDEEDTRLFRAVTILLERSGERLVHTDRLLKRLHPAHKVKVLLSQIVNQKKRLLSLLALYIQKRKETLAGAIGALDALSPLNVLQRGYSICLKLPDEKIIRQSAELSIGDRIRTRFHEGHVISEVKDVKKNTRP